MTRVEEELNVLRQLVANFEKALAGLERELLPHNPKSFDLFSFGIVEQLGKLRAELAERESLSVPSRDVNGAIKRDGNPAERGDATVKETK